MSPQEEQEIMQLLEMRSISEVTALSDELKREVHRLEAENINDLINSHQNIKDILDLLDKVRFRKPCLLFGGF